MRSDRLSKWSTAFGSRRIRVGDSLTLQSTESWRCGQRTGSDRTPNLRPLDEIGSPFEVEHGVRFKAYPCGGLTHPAIDGILALRAENGLRSDAEPETTR